MKSSGLHLNEVLWLPLLCTHTHTHTTSQELGSFLHPCEGDLVCKGSNEKVPYFNAPLYLENKSQIGKVDDIFGPMQNYVSSMTRTFTMFLPYAHTGCHHAPAYTPALSCGRNVPKCMQFLFLLYAEPRYRAIYSYPSSNLFSCSKLVKVSSVV